MKLYVILSLICIFIIFCVYMKQNKKYKLSLMAIFRSEHEYLKEWLDHHIAQGVDHFYLYSNDEKMYNYKFLDQYTCITLIPWTAPKNDQDGTIQRKAYTHCVKTYGNESQYLMMVDIDEFLTPTQSNTRVIDFINSIDTLNTKAIKVQRYDFGSNGHTKKPKTPVTESYKKHESVCSSYKTMANTDYIDKNAKFYGVHDFVFLNKSGKVYNSYFNYTKNNYEFKPNGCDVKSKNEIPFVLNHYYTKSYEEYMDRCKMWEGGGVNNIRYRKDCEKLFHEKENTLNNE